MSDVHDELAVALTGHYWREFNCSCGWRRPADWSLTFMDHQADLLAPVVARLIAEAEERGAAAVRERVAQVVLTRPEPGELTATISVAKIYAAFDEAAP